MKFKSDQKGVTLIVGMIMLLLMTIVGLAAIRGSGLQESMASNMRDFQLAFQATEGGLSLAESLVVKTPTNLPPVCSKNGPVCFFEGGVTVPVTEWVDNDWNKKDDRSKNIIQSAVNKMNIEQVADQPSYVIEKVFIRQEKWNNLTKSGYDLGSLNDVPLPDIYRVSARGVGIGANTQAVVQSSFVQ